MTDPKQVERPSLGKTVDLPFEEVLAKIEQALEREKFGVLTRIDVQATLKKKLDVDFPPFQILGACMPPMAHKALVAEPEIAVMLPCNVVVRGLEAGGTRVEVVNTATMAQMFPQAGIEEVASTVGRHLERVLDAV
jgi:uncharacterized protein (DUF302 family)